MKTKTFDCVEMKRRGAEVVRQKLAGMTVEQEIEYWRRRSEEFQQEQERLRIKAGIGPHRSQSPSRTGLAS